jgi:hypothetical protein
MQGAEGLLVLVLEAAGPIEQTPSPQLELRRKRRGLQ